MFLDFFDENKTELEEMKAHYRRGGLGDGVVKKRLVEILDALITPIRDRRRMYESDPAQVDLFLKEGTAKARAVAQSKITEVKAAMRLIY
jgi:tryptophanyl-tRNA synthetase